MKKPEKTYDQMLDELREDFPCEPDWVLEQVLAKHGWEKPEVPRGTPVKQSSNDVAPSAEPVETLLRS